MSVGTSDHLRQISQGSSIRLSWEGLNQGEAYQDSELHTHEILGPILQGDDRSKMPGKYGSAHRAEQASTQGSMNKDEHSAHGP